MKTTLAKLATLITLYLLGISLSERNCDAQSFADSHLARFISTEEGLTNNYIDDLLIDDAGFIWAATSGSGICRYDGYEFISISTNLNPRIRNNFVKNIEEDGFRRIWIGSEGGIDVIDIEHFSNIDISDFVPKDLSGQAVSYLRKSADGSIWAVIGENVLRFSFDEKGEIKSAGRYSNPAILLNSVAIKDAEGNGSMWIGIEGKVYRISAGADNKLTAKHILDNLDCGKSTWLSDFLIKDNEVWISSSDGIFRYNTNGSTGKHYVHIDSDPNSLSQNYITSLALTPEKEVIAASLLGLNVYNPIEDNFERVIYDPDLEGTDLLSSNFINCMIVHGSNIWLGSENAGIIQLHSKELAISNLVNQKNKPESLAPNNVNAIFQDPEGKIWVGTVESGISCMSEDWDGFRHLTTANSGLSHNSVSAFSQDGEGRVWVGSWGGGTDVLEGEWPGRVTMNIKKCSQNGADISFVGALEYDRYNNLMWIGCNGGIFFCDLGSGETYPALDNQTYGCIGSVVDNEGRLWMGGQTGVQIFGLKDGSMEAGKRVFPVIEFRYKLDNPKSETLEKVSCIYQSKDGTIWIGSTGNGFYQVTETEGNISFKNYSTANGLVNDSVKYILEDSDGRLWISTENGLSRFNPKNESFISYTKADGLISNQFYWNAGLEDRNGKLYFGSNDGLCIIDPSESGRNDYVPNLTITGITIGHESDNDPYRDRLKLHERDKSITISFSDLAFCGMATSRYSYILEGQNDDWIELPPKRNFISFNSLRKGKYTLRIKAINNGDGSESVVSLPIKVRPYFYHSWIFYIFILFMAAAAFTAFHQARLRNLVRQKEALEKIVEERTLEIKDQKKLVEQKAEELARQNKVLLRQNEELAGHRMLEESHAVEDKFAKKCVDIVREHYKDPDFDVPSFCEEMAMSKTLLNKKMQDSIGQSIGQFIRTYRLSIAKELLINNHGNKTISEIAYEAGFNDPKYFARCFQKEVGMTPSSFGKISEQ